MIVNIKEASLVELKRVEEIFFETSSVKQFKSNKEKSEFKYKYLNRYIDKNSDYFYLLKKNNEVLGYVCGQLAPDEELLTLFPYYKTLEQELLIEFPSHLHINLTQESRGLGVGSELIKYLVDLFRRNNSSGVHILTGINSRNIGFYRKNNFKKELSVEYNSVFIYFMGRKINSL